MKSANWVSKRIGFLAVLLLATGTASTSQASATFGLNAGATYVLSSITGIDGQLGVPVGGIHLILGDSKSHINLRNYLEYVTTKVKVPLLGLETTTKEISLTPLLTLNLGMVAYLGVGPVVSYDLDPAAGADTFDINAALALGFNLGPKFFLEFRGVVDVTPATGVSMTDLIVTAAQLGFHFGPGRK